MSFADIATLFGGLALFLFGMRVMGDGLERAAGSRLKHFLSLMTSNRFVAMLTGLCFTAVIQSSGATTVMVVGFVNAKMLTLSQAVGVIIGANLGTTVTSLLLSVKFDPGPIFSFIGILMVMCSGKKETIKQFGNVLLGLGVLFTGMSLMSEAMVPLREWDVFLNMMSNVSNPFLGVIVGVLVTALLQSSSVSVGIIQMMAAAGLITLNGAMYLVLGAQIGACTPTILAMANTNVSAKRAAIAHVVYNVFKTALLLILASFLPISSWFEAAVPDNPKFCISCMHIGFNVIAMIIMLPARDLLVRAATLLVPGKDEEEKALKMQYYDPRLLKTPTLAAEQLYLEVRRMGREVHTHILLAIEALQNFDISKEEEIEYHEELSDYLEESITEGLVAVMPSTELSEHESHRIASLFHVVNDLERISDHATSLFLLAKERVNKNTKLTDRASEEINDLFTHVLRVLDTALEGLDEWQMPDNVMILLKAEEKTIEEMTESLRKKHIERLKDHKCSPKSGVIFIETISSIGRVGDYAMNIASAPRNEASAHQRPNI